MARWVYDFAAGSKDMRDLLGGKGANVAEMTRVLGPDRVPPGFRAAGRSLGPLSGFGPRSRRWPVNMAPTR